MLDHKKIYATVLDAVDHLVKKDGSGKFTTFEEYFKAPQLYKSTFPEQVGNVKYTDCNNKKIYTFRKLYF